MSIPDHILADLEAYRIGKHPYPFGSFVTAILANDFVTAAGYADSTNQHLLLEYAHYLYNRLPRAMWGSYDIVEQEIERQRTATFNGD